MSKPAYYTVCVDNPPKGIKAAQTYPGFTAARTRAQDLAKLGLVAAVYETNAAGAAKKGADPVHVSRPAVARPAPAKPAKPAKTETAPAAAKPVEATKPPRKKAAT